MLTRSRKRTPSDPILLAAAIIEEATGTSITKAPTREKNPAAVALGRLGAVKGGLARAKALSKARRKAIAKKAAKARWIKASS